MLDARKLARIVSNRARMRQGRTRTVTLVYARPEGTTYLAANVVWRPQLYAEPQVADGAVQKPEPPAAVRAEFPPELDPRLVSLLADTPTATAASVATAPAYEVLSYRAAGMSMNRWVVELKRVR